MCVRGTGKGGGVGVAAHVECIESKRDAGDASLLGRSWEEEEEEEQEDDDDEEEEEEEDDDDEEEEEEEEEKEEEEEEELEASRSDDLVKKT